MSVDPFLVVKFVKEGTNVRFSDNVNKFPELILGVGQQQY